MRTAPKFIGTDNFLEHRIESGCDGKFLTGGLASGCDLYRYPAALSPPAARFVFEDVYPSGDFYRESATGTSGDMYSTDSSIYMPLTVEPTLREDMILFDNNYICPASMRRVPREPAPDMNYRQIAIFARGLVNGMKYRFKVGGQYGFEKIFTSRPTWSAQYRDWVDYITGIETETKPGIWRIENGLKVPPTGQYWERFTCDAYQRYIDRGSPAGGGCGNCGGAHAGLPRGSHVLGYVALTTAGMQCKLDKTLHVDGVLLPAKAGECMFCAAHDWTVAHPERRPLGEIRRAIERSERLAKECRSSLHRDFAPITILMHAGPYVLYRIWKTPDGTLIHKPMPEIRRKRRRNDIENSKKGG